MEPIELSWGQKLAAFWTIAWPAQLGGFLFTMTATVVWTAVAARTDLMWLGVATVLVYLAGLGVFVRRLVRKRYRTFRIVVERPDGTTDLDLSMREALEVALPIIALQAIFTIGVWVVSYLLGHSMDARTLQSTQWLAVWARILIVGPYSVRLAIAFRYQGFRLKAYAVGIAPAAAG